MIRLKFVRLVNAIIVISFLGLLMVFIQNPYPPVDEHSEAAAAVAAVGSYESRGERLLSANSLPVQCYCCLKAIEESLKESATFISSPLSINDVVSSIEFLNNNYEILNMHRFGPVSEAKFVIVVQVHNRIEYLRYLIESLQKAKYINEVLSIFSHDYSSPDINELIKQIRFCRVLQIFYPYNIQLFPTVFPGTDPNDCAADMTKEKAKQQRCNNWAHPDKYGHYRVAKLTQIKHHWWWKINYVFDVVMKRYNLDKAWVILLEEDHYVAPDFIHVLQKVIDNKKQYCEQCQVVSLGLYLKQYSTYGDNIASLIVHPWFSSKHNMGMAFDVNTWNLIKNCSKEFCTYDDYNWDWSLLHISMKCLPKKLRVIALKAPRVIHVGDCGVHTHRCNVQNAPKKAQELFSSVEKRLFPASLRVVENSRRMLKPSKENGGWGDSRDHQLCINNSMVNVQPSLVDSLVVKGDYDSAIFINLNNSSNIMDL
ncbi:unnamed protein product [Anisakis simplex]|uniref:Alpha-1,6-mannosyl-glycoprotein 2-beta-N-acetylglucosaminyltransferase n=1 Tax=Anisakis simplex TaxID=6269 RepID=A0A0M3IY86_ANISI|nr:unnamed protein product [Anisakis simplex]